VKKAAGNFRALKLGKGRGKGSGGGGVASGGLGRRYNSFASRKAAPQNSNPYQGVVEDPTIDDTLIQKKGSKAITIESIGEMFVGDDDMRENDENICAIRPQFLSTCIGETEEVDSQVIAHVDLLKSLKLMSGFTSFKPAQLDAISLIMNGKSTLVSIPTGAGKSLTYQVPAFVIRCWFALHGPSNPNLRQNLVIVISPTISLMYDQMRCLPSTIRGACINSSASYADQKETFNRLSNDLVDVLFISPERLLCPSFSGFVNGGNMPPVRLICVDEIHCVSEWSHNFRSAYIALPLQLKSMFGDPVILGLTATSTSKARKDIFSVFGITQEVLINNSCVAIRENIKCTISRTDNKDLDLIKLLESPTYKNLKSIIIYTMFQNQADRVSVLLARKGMRAESYHGGKSVKDRQSIQKRFMAGKIEVLVATIAFGLGVNKKDVRSVIHYSLPKSVENYVQEIGRSGRDGLDSFCHLFLTKDDYVKQRCFSYSDGVEEASIWRFLLKVFGSSGPDFKPSRNNIISLNLQDIECDFDMNETQISTLLQYIVLEDRKWIDDFGVFFAEYKIHFTKTALPELAKTNPFVDLLCKTYPGTSKSTFEIDTLSFSRNLGISTQEFNQILIKLKAKREIFFETSNKSFFVKLGKIDRSDEDAYDDLLETLKSNLCTKLAQLEKVKVDKIEEMYSCMNQHSYQSITHAIEKGDVENRVDFENRISEYFNDMRDEDLAEDEELLEKAASVRPNLHLDIKQFIIQNKDTVSNARIVARIFQGISSPKFPSAEWSRSSFWNKYPFINFQDLHRLAQKVLNDIRLKK